MGHVATVGGILLSVVAAYAAARFNNIMDLLQLVFAFVNAPLFATFLLGMFWRRTTGHGAFYGLVAGTAAAAVHHGLTVPRGATVLLKGGWMGALLGLPPAHLYPSEMGQNFWTAIWAWSICFAATVLVSLVTRRQKSDDELRGLVYSLTPVERDHGLAWYLRPSTLGIAVLAAVVALNIVFW